MFPTVNFYHQLGGEAGIIQTVGMMKQLAERASTHPWIRERAISLVSYCKRNRICEERTLTGWTNGAIKFIRDPHGTEALHDPATYYEAIMRSGRKPAGDCDDMSTYLAALLKSVGHNCYFKIIDRIGNGYHHVMVYCDGNTYDPTLEYPVSEQPKRELYFEV
jgi:hypothetical protein